jgi:hypothetical protein
LEVVSITDSGADATYHEDDLDYEGARPTPPFFWFANDIIVVGDQGAAWEMPYKVFGTKAPVEIDITRADRWDPWLQRCIVEVVGDTLRICGAGSETQPRPVNFTSSADDEQILYVAERCDEPVPK